MNSLTDRADLRNWLFKGVTVEQVLDDLERDGLAVRSASDSRAVQRVMPLEDFSEAIRRGAMAALPAYLASFCVENSARELVAERLAENHGAEWWEACVPSAIRIRVESRRQKEGVDRWHAARGASEIHYVDFGDLKDIIQANWVDFSDLFPDQNWVVGRLGELEASRNIIAHSNILEERELIRLRLYLQDWTRQVG